MDYIIVQAGGKGTRLKHLTSNKPKALVPVNNLPMLFHLFKRFPDKRFVIIADYHRKVLREYLAAFSDVKYLVIEADGQGTCGGVKQALELIPENESFMLIWSDLILPEEFSLPAEYENNCTDNKQSELSGNYDRKKNIPEHDYVGLSGSFPCRWKFVDDMFVEESSVQYGVAGFFLFRDKSCLTDVPKSGELVRWMRDRCFSFDTVSLAGTKEYGLLEEYEKLEQQKCRPFNRITVENDILTKEPVDSQGEKLAVRERRWYEKAKELDISILPRIESLKPLRMEYIRGKNIYDCCFSYEEKRKLLKQLIGSLKELHDSESVPADYFSMKEAYYNKTIERISKIRDLVPFAGEPFIIVNDRKCRNVFYHQRELETALEKLCCERFPFIHGDCTFSNMMVRDNGAPVLIDPRGYFGFTELYGDVRYDWAKIYYSLVGNYDQFNLKRFTLTIGGVNGTTGSILPEGEVHLSIQSNGWEDMEDEFFRLTGVDRWEIRLLHAVIWLSLTTYAWQDYDSVCGAFYNGLWYLEEVFE